MALNTLGLSGRGRQSHSMLPLGPTNAETSRSDRNPYSPIGGKGLCLDCQGAMSPPTGGVEGFPGKGTTSLLTGNECSPEVSCHLDFRRMLLGMHGSDDDARD